MYTHGRLLTRKSWCLREKSSVLLFQLTGQKEVLCPAIKVAGNLVLSHDGEVIMKFDHKSAMIHLVYDECHYPADMIEVPRASNQKMMTRLCNELNITGGR